MACRGSSHCHIGRQPGVCPFGKTIQSLKKSSSHKWNLREAKGEHSCSGWENLLHVEVSSNLTVITCRSAVNFVWISDCFSKNYWKVVLVYRKHLCHWLHLSGLFFQMDKHGREKSGLNLRRNPLNCGYRCATGGMGNPCGFSVRNMP